MTTTSESTGMAVHRDDRQIKQRMELNKRAGYGLEKATPTQLNIIFLLCQRYRLDPVEDITLFENRPFITLPGRLNLLRQHPDYRGYSCRPLSRPEKEAWGYEPDDIVIEATVRTANWGEISARGKVARTEIDAALQRAEQNNRRPAPIGVHPVEIAEKRAIARAERAAFGQSMVLDDDQIDDAVRTVVEERTDPEKVAQDAARYREIYGSDDDADEAALVGEEHQDERPPTREEMWADNRRLVAQARQRQLTGFPTTNVHSGDDMLAQANTDLAQRIHDYDLDQKLAAEQAAL